MLVMLLRKETITLNNHNHDKYVDTPEFNKLAEDAFMQDWHKQVW